MSLYRLKFVSILAFLFCAILPSFCDDYYSLLGVPRSATSAEIRRAFKNIALKQHPDKNKDDPHAHEKFVKLNKAYEVLKDQELRKKYDLYGEDGLKDNHFGEQYQSWEYYSQEFGIYDNDPEIITLNHGDFEQSVQNSNDIWFINFYSPYCSHCHQLAPTWREVARELDGVVRIGAINCNDEWSLCNEQGIRGYPTLKLYPSGDTYDGPRTTQALTTFMLQSIEVHLAELTSVNLKQVTEEGSLPWIVCVCSPDEDCLSHEAKLKLAAMLDNLVHVGEVNCVHDDSLCDGLGVTSGVLYFSEGKVDKGKGKRIESLFPSDILREVLSLLPAPEEITGEKLDVIAEDLINNNGNAWILVFFNSDSAFSNMELRRLSGLVTEINIGVVNCNVTFTHCQRLYVQKYPLVGLFRHDRYEWHYGRFTAHDIAVFANEAESSNVHTLGPDDFPGVLNANKAWFVDFFAPWCPPCMKLLPEFRKAGRQVGNSLATFGTVDCTVHSQLCQYYNIRSYPTAVLYNNSDSNYFTGYHKASDIIDFIEDTRNPSVVTLTPETFETLINQKPVGETWLVDFYAPWCGPCMELTPTYRKLAKKLKEEAKVGSVDCQLYQNFCQTMGITAYPSIYLYPHNSPGSGYYIQHSGWRDLDSICHWVFGNLPSLTHELAYYSFYSDVISSESPWLVDFYAPWCGHCVQFAPEFEKVAKILRSEVKCGKVNCDEHIEVCRDAGIQAYPTIKYYAGALAKGMSQTVFGSDLNVRHADGIVTQVRLWNKEFQVAKLEEQKRKAEKKKSKRPKDEF